MCSIFCIDASGMLAGENLDENIGGNRRKNSRIEEVWPLKL